MMKLTPMQEAFCQAMVKTKNQSEAYRKAYNAKNMLAKTVHEKACGLMQKDNVRARVDELNSRVLAKAEIDAAEIVRHLADIVQADPNDLMQFRRLNCRFCNGHEHNYQWKHKGEFQKAMDDWEAAREAHHDRMQRATKQTPFTKPMPTDEGGYGFKNNSDPVADCPVCEGEGVEDLFIQDSRKLSGPARRLYAGVKQTKNGIEVLTRSQDGALKMLGEHYGMFKQLIDANIKSQNENTNTNLNSEPLGLEELKALAKARGLPESIFDKRK